MSSIKESLPHPYIGPDDQQPSLTRVVPGQVLKYALIDREPNDLTSDRVFDKDSKIDDPYFFADSIHAFAGTALNDYHGYDTSGNERVVLVDVSTGTPVILEEYPLSWALPSDAHYAMDFIKHTGSEYFTDHMYGVYDGDDDPYNVMTLHIHNRYEFFTEDIFNAAVESAWGDTDNLAVAMDTDEFSFENETFMVFIHSLIGTHLTQFEYDLVTLPYRAVNGRIHPDDKNALGLTEPEVFAWLESEAK